MSFLSGLAGVFGGLKHAGGKVLTGVEQFPGIGGVVKSATGAAGNAAGAIDQLGGLSTERSGSIIDQQQQQQQPQQDQTPLANMTGKPKKTDEEEEKENEAAPNAAEDAAAKDAAAEEVGAMFV
jgi:hypothetical protein